MINELQRKGEPPFLRDDFHQVLLNLDRFGVFGQVEPLRKPLHVGIHHDAFQDAVGAAKHYVGCFARGAGNSEQVLHAARNLAAEVRENLPGGANQRLGFVVEEPGGPDVLSQFGLIRAGEIGHGRIFLEQAGRHFVYALVRALSGENSGYQKLPRIAVKQRNLNARVHRVQALHDLANPRGAVGGGFGTGN